MAQLCGRWTSYPVAGVGLSCTGFRSADTIPERTHCVERIKDIVDYACNTRIIDGCRLAVKEFDCKLIEVEQLWTGTDF